MKYSLYTIFFLCCVACLSAQNCGFQDTTTFSFGDTTVISFEVFDAINDDLSRTDQAICSFRVDFDNSEISRLEMWLVSPIGDTVQLIGPKTTGVSGGTLGSLWNITFVNDSVNTNPSTDFPFGAIFDNRSNVFTPGNYSGEYYPFEGSLRDFNRGPVNGTWELLVHFDPQLLLIPSTLNDLRIDFCDPLGYDCCFADAGRVSNIDSIAACVGSTDLILAPNIIHTDSLPDSTQYDYTYVIGTNDLIIGYFNDVDLSGLPAGSYEICGLSYQIDQSGDFPLSDSTFSVDSLRDNLDGLNPLFCGQMVDTCIHVRILAPSDTNNIGLQNICSGDSLMIGDSILKNPGQYTISLLNQAGCDSTVQVEINTIDAIRDTISESTCPGVPFTFNGVDLDTTGFYEFRFSSSNGCDSIIVVDFTLLEITSEVFVSTNRLNCVDTASILSVIANDPIEELSYRWEVPPFGFVISTDSTITVTEPGFIFIQVVRSKDGKSCPRRFPSIDIQADTLAPQSLPGQNDTLGCGETELQLNGMASSPPVDIRYQWSTTSLGNISDSSILNPMVDAPGIYTLVALDTMNGCSDMASVEIVQDTLVPQIQLVPDTAITCLVDSITLNPIVSPVNSAYTYRWTSRSGRPIRDSLLFNPTIAFADTFDLVVNNPNTGCFASSFTVITFDTLGPAIDILAPDTLTCLQNTVILNASGSNLTSNTAIDWTTVDGNFVSGENTLTPTVNQGGIYSLVLRDSVNGCFDSLSVEVIDTTVNLIASIGQIGLLTCDPNQGAILNIDNSSRGNDIQYQWSDLDNGVFSSLERDSIEIFLPGRYQLIVQDQLSGCLAAATISAQVDTIAPQIDTGPVQELSCANDIVVLNGSGSGAGQLEFNWTGPCVIGNANFPSISADCEGTFVLSVTDLSNSCVNVDSVLVGRNASFPNPLASDTILMSCIDGLAELDGSASTGGQIEWFSGNTLIGSGSSSVTVDTPGRFLLQVRDTVLGCVDSMAVLVLFDCQPNFDIPIIDTLNCATPTVTIDASNVGVEGVLDYRWTRLQGCDPIDIQSAQITVDCPSTYRLIATHQLTGQADTIVITVEEDPVRPVAFAGADTVLNCFINGLSLDGEVSSSGEHLSYRWEDTNQAILGAQGQIRVDTAGQYILIVTDTVRQCSARDTVSVFPSPSPQFQIPQPSSLTCLDSSVVLSVALIGNGDSLTFNWTSPANSAIINSDQIQASVTTAGLYFLEVTNQSNGCSTIDSIEVIADRNLPIADAGPDLGLNCGTNSIIIDGSNSSQGDSIGYLWLSEMPGAIISAADSNNIEVNQTGSYILVTFNLVNGCTDQDTVIVLPVSDLPTLNIPTDSSITCNDPVITIDAGVVGTSLISTWSILGPDGSAEIRSNTDLLSTDEAGTYQITIIDTLTQCQDSAQIQISAAIDSIVFSLGPDINLDCNATNIILGPDISFDLDSFEYEWIDSTGAIIATTSSLVVSSAQVYNLLVTNRFTGCSGQSSVTVLNEASTAQISINQGLQLDCENGTSTLTLMSSNSDLNNFSITWSSLDGLITSDPSGQTISITSGGLYQVELVDNSTGCTSNASIAVSENGRPITGISFIAQLDDCEAIDQGVLQLTNVNGGDGPYLLSLNGGTFLTGTTVNLDGSLNNQINIEDINGCTFDTSFLLSEVSIPSLELTSDTTIERGDSLLLTVAINNETPGVIEWILGSQVIQTGVDNITVQPIRTTTYLVRFSTNDGCTVEDQVTVFVEEGNLVYLPNAFSPDENGFNDTFVPGFNSKVARVNSFQIFDRWGNAVFQAPSSAPSDPRLAWDGTKSSTLCQSGIYIYWLEVELNTGEIRMFKGEVALLR